MKCGVSVQEIRNLQDFDKLRILYDDRWSSEKPGLSMHSLHAYPAKFPPFLASAAFEYAIEEGVIIQSTADIFCGCGTTALESKIRGIDFWGCDINPVAVLITKAKTYDYNLESLNKHYNDIIEKVNSLQYDEDKVFALANERLKYWFDKKSYVNLYKIINSIYMTIPTDNQEEMIFFQCVFSAILKQCSKWLQKSIKPQIDPLKGSTDVIKEFANRYKKAYISIKQIEEKTLTTKKINIEHANYLECENVPCVDLIITSPPYVTSYEYADLHQLSSLWLKYADDYKKLRQGTIGSKHIPQGKLADADKLNNTASEIIKALSEKKCPNSKMYPISLYYSDMQKAVRKCYRMMNNNGMIVFVIGDSELQGVKLQNSRHLVETMLTEGFTNVKISKRQVSKGICVPYRDEHGKFTYQKTANNEIYHEEYIISARCYHKKEYLL